MGSFLALLTGNPLRTGAIVLVLALIAVLALRGCDDKAGTIERTAREAGALQVENAGQGKVIDNARKVAEADAAHRGRSVADRMRGDPDCRDCDNAAPGE